MSPSSVGIITRGSRVDSENPLPVVTFPAVGQAFTDRSGTIATGGTSQQIAATNATRRYLVIQNHSDTDMWLGIGTAAVAGQPSIKLYANGGTYEPLVAPTSALHLICAGAGKAYTCKEA